MTAKKGYWIALIDARDRAGSSAHFVIVEGARP